MVKNRSTQLSGGKQRRKGIGKVPLSPCPELEQWADLSGELPDDVHYETKRGYRIFTNNNKKKLLLASEQKIRF